MNILFLAHRIPYPPNKGDKIRSFNMIKYLSQRHHIYLGTILDHQSDVRFVQGLKPFCKDIKAFHLNKKTRLLKSVFNHQPFTVSSFYHAGLQGYVDSILKNNKIDAVICFSSSMAEYIFKTPDFKTNHLNDKKLIMDFIDLDSDKWLQYANYTHFPVKWIYKEEKKRLLEYEKKINQVFHHSVFVSQRELDVFQKEYPAANNVTIISNGVDTEYFTPKSKQPANEHPVLLFTGVMDYFANIDGVKWFSEKIYTRIKAELPKVRFYIVGTRPTRCIRNLARKDGITVTGFVNDIREYYWNADVCVTPLRIARGLQNKVLEAMATGNAVVATSNAKNGILCHENKDIMVANDEESFSKQVISLLKNPEKRHKLGANAVKNIRENYSWEENLRKIDDLL